MSDRPSVSPPVGDQPAARRRPAPTRSARSRRCRWGRPRGWHRRRRTRGRSGRTSRCSARTTPMRLAAARAASPSPRAVSRARRLLGGLADLDAPGRDLPAPGVGDEPVAPQQQHAAVGVVHDRARRRLRVAHDVVVEALRPRGSRRRRGRGASTRSRRAHVRRGRSNARIDVSRPRARHPRPVGKRAAGARRRSGRGQRPGSIGRHMATWGPISGSSHSSPWAAKPARS